MFIKAGEFNRINTVINKQMKAQNVYATNEILDGTMKSWMEITVNML